MTTSQEAHHHFFFLMCSRWQQASLVHRHLFVFFLKCSKWWRASMVHCHLFVFFSSNVKDDDEPWSQGGFGFLAFLHFLVKVPTYKCSTPSGSFHGFVHRLEILRFVHVGCMHIELWLYVPLHVEHFFFHTKSMLLKGDFFGFWISIYWDLEARPMFETMLWADCTRKNNKLILMSKILYLQYVELHVNYHIQY